MTTNTKKSKIQKLWELIRRNPIFIVGEVNAIIDMNHTTLRAFLYALETAKYIRLVEKKRGKDFLHKSYKLIEDTGVVAPSYDTAYLTDHNINKKIVIAKKEDEEFFKEIEATLEYLKINVETRKEFLNGLREKREK